MKRSGSMTSKLFFKLLPVQAMIVAMGSINSIVDGVTAGRFIDARTVGVIGLFGAVLGIIGAITSVILGGSSVLSGRYMGAGDLEKTNGIFSLNVTISCIVGIVAFAVLFFIPEPVAVMCGAKGDLVGSLKLYIVGFSFGVLPQILGTQIATFLQMERQIKRSYIGIATMIVSNIVLNITFVMILKLGVFGLALSTSICNWIYFLVLVTYYFTGKAQLKYKLKNALWDDLGELIRIGLPGALLSLCLAFRNIVLNRIILFYVGEDGLAAKSALGMIDCLFIALCLGGGTVIRTLASVSVGEEDKDTIKELIKLNLTKVLLMCLAITAIVLATARWVVLIFFPDRSSIVYQHACHYFLMFGISIPLIMIVQLETNYLQALKQNLCVHAFSIVDGFLSVVIPAALLTPIIGAWGIWLSTPIGIVISALVYPVYACIYWKRFPKTVDEWLLLREDFGVPDKDRLVINIRSLEDVSTTSVKAQEFCKEHGFAKKTALYCALCLEEMTRNVVTHGFTDDGETHFLDARIVCLDEKVLLRIKDDCKAFDPVDMASRLDPEDITANIGIRMVMNIADETNYQSLLGLNVTTIEFLKDKAIA